MDHIEDFGVYRLVLTKILATDGLSRPANHVFDILELYFRLPFLSNSQLLKGVLKDRSSKGVYYREINPVVFEIYLKMAYVTLKLLTSRGYEHMWTLVINSGTDIYMVMNWNNLKFRIQRTYSRWSCERWVDPTHDFSHNRFRLSVRQTWNHFHREKRFDWRRNNKSEFFKSEFVGHGHKRGLFINTDMTRLRRFGFRTFFRSFYLTKLWVNFYNFLVNKRWIYKKSEDRYCHKINSRFHGYVMRSEIFDSK